MTHSPEFVALVNEAKSHVQEIAPETVQAKLDRGDRFHLIDVREDHEWAQGHIRGAEHLGRGILERDIVGRIPDKDAEIVLYCGGGYRSVLAASNLVKMGYRRVTSMAEGWKGWQRRGFPTA